MTRYKTARVLAGLSALAFFVAAGLHASGYRAVVLQARQGISGVAPLVATLWLAFAAAMAVLGVVVSFVVLGRIKGARWIIAVAGCFPLITVFLQLGFLGFTRATAMLATVAVVSLGAALVFPRTEEPSTAGAP